MPRLEYVGYLQNALRQRLEGLPPRPERLVLAYLSTVGWNSDIMVRSLARAAQMANVNISCVTNARGENMQIDERLRLFDYLPLDELFPESIGL